MKGIRMKKFYLLISFPLCETRFCLNHKLSQFEMLVHFFIAFALVAYSTQHFFMHFNGIHLIHGK